MINSQLQVSLEPPIPLPELIGELCIDLVSNLHLLQVLVHDGHLQCFQVLPFLAQECLRNLCLAFVLVQLRPIFEVGCTLPAPTMIVAVSGLNCRHE